MRYPSHRVGTGSSFTGTGYIRSLAPSASRAAANFAGLRPLTEDWCGDAARSVPVLAQAFDLAVGTEHRYLESGAHPGVILRYLTHGGRAIPMAIVQDEHGRALGAWGPRPAPLQALVRARRRELGPPTPETRAAWYAPIMGWYARDGGKTVLEEILVVLERGGTPR